MKKERERTELGTFKANFDEEMVAVGVRIPKSYKEKLEGLENKAKFLRDAVMNAIDKLPTK